MTTALGFRRPSRETTVLHARLREIVAGPVLSQEDALLCASIHQVPIDKAITRVHALSSLEAVFIGRALEQALNGREPVLAALARRQLEIEDFVIASANHQPQHMPAKVASGIGGAA